VFGFQCSGRSSRGPSGRGEIGGFSSPHPTSDKVFVIEFKCNQIADAAIRQIREKGYERKYCGSGKKIVLMGIDFDTEKRNVKDWKTVLRMGGGIVSKPSSPANPSRSEAI
jgi:hypothetical protein